MLFQWNSADHVPYSQSEQPLPASASTPWDWFHINAVKLDYDGNLLIDARDTWTTYKVSLTSGNIIWQLGGKDSDFTLQAAPGQTLDSANEIFAWQHDPEPIGDNEYTFFDNESSGTALLPYSRAITVKLNPGAKSRLSWPPTTSPRGFPRPHRAMRRRPATEISSSAGESCLTSPSSIPQGKLIFNAEFPTGVNTYRAYLLLWNPPGSGQGGPKGPGGGQGGKGPGGGQGGGQRPQRRSCLGHGAEILQGLAQQRPRASRRPLSQGAGESDAPRAASDSMRPARCSAIDRRHARVAIAGRNARAARPRRYARDLPLTARSRWPRRSPPGRSGAWCLGSARCPRRG